MAVVNPNVHAVFGDPRLPAQFWAKVQPIESGCWIWTGSTKGRDRASASGGYANLAIDGEFWLGHRLAWSRLVGPCPIGKVSDHLCCNKACVNPAHIEHVTSRVNTLRGNTLAAAEAKQEACLRGHAFDDKNTYTRWRRNRPERECRACHNLHGRIARSGKRRAP